MDILVITETWLYSGDDAKLREITPSGYQIVSNPRDTRRGGGVAVICRESYKCEMKTPTDFRSFECLQLELIYGNRKSYIIPVYRPEPNETSMRQFFNEFTRLPEIMCVIPSEILILGDFNIHLDTPGNSNALHFINILKDFNLVQHVLESTHENGHLLDLIIARPTDCVSNVAVGVFF